MGIVPQALRTRLEGHIAQSPVVLFMKGNKGAPACGFSARVVGILDDLVEFSTVDVLSDPEIRDGIKVFSDWPTIPQLYVRGQFVGGCDIVTEMSENGELRTLLGDLVRHVKTPTLTVSPRAVVEFQKALEGAGDDRVRLTITPGYEHGLEIGPAEAGDVVVEAGGLTLHLDKKSAARAGGVHIDFVEGTSEAGFKIKNPNEPPKVIQLKGTDGKRMMDEGAWLIDVRTPAELELAAIQGARFLDDGLEKELERLDKGHPVIFMCHHGIRSFSAAQAFLRRGHRRVFNLAGGIDAWSSEVDSSVAKY